MEVRKPTDALETFDTEYIESLPEGERGELINGKFYAMSSPSRYHQDIIGALYYRIKEFINGNKGDCRVYMAPFAVYITNDKHSYVEPDISVICDKDKLTDRGCEGAPDWIIEVLSPSSITVDKFIKLNKYADSGVREYWIVDPDNSIVTVYSFTGEDGNRTIGSVLDFSFSASIPVTIYEGKLIINLSAELDAL